MLNNFSKKILILAMLLGVSIVFAQPTPPAGKKWQKIENLSDEFENGFNTNKWVDHLTEWEGRVPARFEKYNVSVSGGKLKLVAAKKSSPMYTTRNGKTRKWTHEGAAVGSKNSLSYGYYEVKMKTNRTFMSSTFWMINDRRIEQGCNRRVTELDVVELVGWNTKYNSDFFTKGIPSNSHSRDIPSGCPQKAGIVGNKIYTGEPAWQKYHTYGVWLRDKRNATFYLDGKSTGSITLPADFNIKMYLKFVVESYDHIPPKAGIDGMNRSLAERTTSYEWVHSYKLVNDSSGGNNSGGGNSSNVCDTAVNHVAGTVYNTRTYVKTSDNKVYDVLGGSWTYVTQCDSSSGGNNGGGSTDVCDTAVNHVAGTVYNTRTYVKTSDNKVYDVLGGSWTYVKQCDGSSGGNTDGNSGSGTAFFIVNRQTGKKIAPSGSADGASIIQVDASQNGNIAKWQEVATSGGYFYLKNVSTGQYFRPATDADASKLEQRPTSYSGNYTQWKKVTSSNGYFYLQNRQTQKYIRPQGDGNNSPQEQRPTSWAGNYTQWKFVSTSAKTITSDVSLNIEVVSNPVENGSIELDNADGATYSVNTLLGSEVEAGTVTNSYIDVSSLSSGIYIVVFNKDGKTKMEKVIIK